MYGGRNLGILYSTKVVFNKKTTLFRMVSRGPGENRTLVQTDSGHAFFTLRTRLVFDLSQAPVPAKLKLSP